MQSGESEGKTLLEAMRDGRHDGMQDFDTVIKEMIERKLVTLEDGLAFATNPHNLQLALKGVTLRDDYNNPDQQQHQPRRPAAATPPPQRPRAPVTLDLT